MTRTWTAVAIGLTLGLAACARHPQTAAPSQVTVYYCKVGSNALVGVPYSVNPSLGESRMDDFLVGQLLAGPAANREAFALFPPGTRATVTRSPDKAIVDLHFSGNYFAGGATDEIGMFKSLVYTLTQRPDIKKVQITVDRRTVAALSGGHLELDEPLTRDSFAQ